MKCKPGNVYGIYKVIRNTGNRYKDGHTIFEIECLVCGKHFEMPANSFASKHSIVVTCRHDKYNANHIKNKHLRGIFRKMVDRCTSPKSKDFKRYGKRGIYVCDEWMQNPAKFEQWSLSHGYLKGLTIDRKNNDGPYAPWNCRWVTAEYNAKYKSTTNLYSVDDITDSGRGWAKRLKLSTNHINKLAVKQGSDFTMRFIRDSKDGFITLIPKS